MPANDNVSVVKTVLQAWEEKDTKTFLAQHADQFTFTFLPNDIPALQSFCPIKRVVNHASLQKWNESTWGPGKPLCPTAKPDWRDVVSTGDKCYMNGFMPISFFGMKPIDFQFFFCFTLKNGKIMEANINGDISTIPKLIRNLQESNVKAFQNVYDLWSQQKIDECIACHAEDFTAKICPCQIEELKDWQNVNDREEMKNFMLKAHGPGGPFEWVSPPIMQGLHGIGDKVLFTMTADMKSFGKGPVPMEMKFEVTMEKGMVKKMLLLADTTELAALF
jgi:ketosteroid isomerase-like protein